MHRTPDNLLKWSSVKTQMSESVVADFLRPPVKSPDNVLWAHLTIQQEILLTVLKLTWSKHVFYSSSGWNLLLVSSISLQLNAIYEFRFVFGIGLRQNRDKSRLFGLVLQMSAYVSSSLLNVQETARWGTRAIHHLFCGTVLGSVYFCSPLLQQERGFVL